MLHLALPVSLVAACYLAHTAHIAGAFALITGAYRDKGAKSKAAHTRSRSREVTEVYVIISMLEKHLRQAEEHVTQGRQHLARQMAVITKLEQAGRNTTVARELLETFGLLQDAHEADRDRLEKELGKRNEKLRTEIRVVPSAGAKSTP